MCTVQDIAEESEHMYSFFVEGSDDLVVTV